MACDCFGTDSHGLEEQLKQDTVTSLQSDG